MRISRKVFISASIGMLIFSLIAVNAQPNKATIHIQTFGYEGRDVLKLTVDVTGEDSDYLFIAVNPGVLNRVKKEINIENLPVIPISDTTFRVPKDYLTEIGPDEYRAVVRNDVAKMKWNIKDKTAGMNGNDIVSVLVWFKEINAYDTVGKHGVITYEFLSGMGAAVDIRVSNIKALSEEAAIEFVEEDGISYITLSSSVPLINADDVWSMGYDGSGISICIIDTGIDPYHCDFLPEKIVAWADFVGSGSTPYDDHGHGTHCASIAAGADSPYGVAKGASLMGAKVCSSSGSCSDSAIIQGIDFGVAQGADVESLSLSGPGGDGTSAIAQECNWAVSQGVVVVVAAGNSGSSCCTIGTPGDATNVITVGASGKSDGLASFSSRGPTTDGRIKPDITAPGVSIYAAFYGTCRSDIGMSGTSMATPHIAGVAALMLDARGTATPLQVKNCMGATAIDKGNTNKDCLWGWGRVDAYAAVNQIISNPNVSPPPDGDCGCECGGGFLSSSPLFYPLPLSSSPSVTITNPINGSEVHGTVNITVSANYIDEARFYIDTSLKYTDTAAPFQWDWDTTQYSNGSHTILVEGFCCGYFVDSDTVTVTVDNCYVEIANPPPPGETVSCTVSIDVETGCVDMLEFYIDGVLVFTDFTAPFQFIWDTCLYSDGSHTVTVRGYSSGVLIGSDAAVYQVDHYYVKITNPQHGEEVSGILPITVDANCVDTVELYIDDVLQHTESIDPPHEGGTFQYNWDTCLYSYGTHTVKVKSYEGGQFKRFDEITVQVDNDYVEITNPQQGESVECTVLITTDASCIDVVTFVEFYVDGILLCTDGSYPFECEWDTCSYSNGEHTLEAKAYAPELLCGSVGILEVLIDSHTITCQVDNPVIEITNPQNEEFVFGTVLVTTNNWCCADKVEFYIDGVLKDTKFYPQPFEYSWDTTSYEEDEPHTIFVKAYCDGVSKGTDEVTVIVDNHYVRITNPQHGEEVSDTVTITLEYRGVDTVQFYIDDYHHYTDNGAPFEYEWDTTSHPEDESATIKVNGYVGTEYKATHTITVTVNNIYVRITSPQEGEEVSGTFLISTDTKGIDTVRFYIDDINNPCECEDTAAPFECSWDTTQYANGDHTIIARGYALGDFQDQDTVTCTVCNGSAGLWLGIFMGCTGIIIRRR